MIEVETNRNMFGKRNRTQPFKATMNGVTVLAYGTTKLEAKLNAQTELESVYVAAQAQMVFRVASDGTMFVGRWTGKDRIEYAIVRKPFLNLPNYVMGECQQSLQSYLDKVVAQYDECTASYDKVSA